MENILKMNNLLEYVDSKDNALEERVNRIEDSIINFSEELKRLTSTVNNTIDVIKDFKTSISCYIDNIKYDLDLLDKDL